MAGVKMDKNAYRRAQKKAKKRQQSETPAVEAKPEPTPAPESKAIPVSEPTEERDELDKFNVEPELVDPEDPLYKQFKNVLGRFQQDPAEIEQKKGEMFMDDDDDIPDDPEEVAEQKPGKKARKKAEKWTIANLKAEVKKPELVEWTDIDASDPVLLVDIKSQKNVVPVPSHWSLKREYLSSKRGVEKPPFSLPKFIQETGIAEMRDAVLEKQAEATLKQKQRERVQPKMGKMDIDYHKLYEAFFRFQTKPELTRFGEVYYEGKEYETNLKHLRPGELSDELKDALSIPPGAPPPWLINQQRFGPPPSYPALKIPGLNAPPPPGSSWGFHPGGYGKPPVDENNRPLYGGDIFGVAPPPQQHHAGEPVEKALWGEVQPVEEAADSSSEEDSDVEDQEEDATTPNYEDVSGDVQTGGQTAPISEFGSTQSAAGDFTLRKGRAGTETEDVQPRNAYTVLPQRDISAKGFFGGDHAYDLSAARNPNARSLEQEQRGRKRHAGDVDVSVNPDAIISDGRLGKDEINRRYDEGRKEAQPWGTFDQEDLGDMIAEEQAKRQKKDAQEAAARRNRGRR